MTEDDAAKLEGISLRRTELKMELESLAMAEAEIIGKTARILPGDKVRKTNGRMTGVVFVVHQVHPIASLGSGGKPWISGYQIRKDGTRGMILKHLYYEWEKIDGVSSERGEA